MIKYLLLLTLSLNAMAQLTNTQKQELIAKNLLKNAGGENGISRWTASAGTFAHTTTAAQVGSGKGALSWDAAADGNTLRSSAVAIPSGAHGNNGVAFCSFKGASAVTHEIGVYDGSNELTSVAITSSTDKFTMSAATFIFPSSGNIQLQIKAKANEAALYIDDCFLGIAEGTFLSNVSQAELVGTLEYVGVTNCQWETTSTSFASFAADADCNTPTVTGSLVAPGTKLTSTTLNNVKPGKYVVFSNFIAGQSGQNYAAYQIHDGSSDGGSALRPFPNESVGGGGTESISLVGTFIYETGQSSITWEIEGAASAGTTQIENTDSSNGFYIKVMRFPLDSQQAATFSTSGWLIDATISGSTVTNSTGAVSAWAGMTNGSLTLTNQTTKGSDSSAQIGCSSTNSPSGTTCSAGDESVSISFIPPRAGVYEACAQFGSAISNTATVAGGAYYQIMETATNAQTVIQEGGGVVLAGSANVSADTIYTPNYVCGSFYFANTSRRMIRLMYEQLSDVSGHFIQANGGATGDAKVRWIVRPSTQNFPAPIINNSITTNSSGAFRLEKAFVDNGAGASCSSSPCTVSRETGDWISSVTRSGTGVYAITFVTGAFSSAPSCFFSTGDTLVNITVGSLSATNLDLTTINNAGSAANARFEIMCMGER
jgi:hypothetical protein